jgi:hypothetical protein
MKMPGILKAIGKTKLFRFRICILYTRACLASYTLCHYHIPDRQMPFTTCHKVTRASQMHGTNPDYDVKIDRILEASRSATCSRKTASLLLLPQASLHNLQS